MLLNLVLEKTLESPLDSKESNQSTLKEVNPEYSLEGLMLKLKLQYLGHLIQRADSLEMALILGKIEGKRKRGQQRMRWLYNITYLMAMNLNKLWEILLKDRTMWKLQFVGLHRDGHQLATEQTQQSFSFCLS